MPFFYELENKGHNSNNLIINKIVFIPDSKKLKVFLDILLELKDAGAHFTDADIRDEVITMMIGVRGFL